MRKIFEEKPNYLHHGRKERRQIWTKNKMNSVSLRWLETRCFCLDSEWSTGLTEEICIRRLVLSPRGGNRRLSLIPLREENKSLLIHRINARDR